MRIMRLTAAVSEPQEGWTNNEEMDAWLDARMAQTKEEAVTSQPDMVIYGTTKKHEATGRIRIRSPPRLPLELSMSIRDAAVKAFMVTPSRPSSLCSLQENETSAPRALWP